jgi:putative addiction module component (TIGR02574 family)
MKATELPTYQELSTSEKLLLVEEIWDEITRHPDDLPIPAWHKAELNRRYQEYQRNPRQGSSWEEVKARLLDQK